MGETTLAWVQGLFYVVTGLWPLLHMRSFTAVTGPKKEVWLVQTVGLLLAVSGAVMILSAARKLVPIETVALAAGEALVLAGVDVRYAVAGRISKIYLADAVVELLFVLMWWITWGSS